MLKPRRRKFNRSEMTKLAARNLTLAQEYVKLTQVEISEKSHVQQRTVGRYLHGEQTLSVEILAALAAALGFEAWQMLVESFDPANPPRLARAPQVAHAKHDDAELEKKVRAILSSMNWK